MIESRETTADVQKQSDPEPAALSETATTAVAPAIASGTTAGNRETQKQVSPVRSTDRRSEQRYANAMKARAGHRRNIRRSNTNG